MGGKNVKNTIVERILQIVAPHLCFGCGKMGVLLCDDCKYDIINEPFVGCILCGRPEVRGICLEHGVAIERAFTVGQRVGTLKELINAFKFQNVRSAMQPLGRLFNDSLPSLPQETTIVPIPTVASHIRARGYDHADLLARQLAASREVEIRRLLVRRTSATQHTTDRVHRQNQAQVAFSLTSIPEIALAAPLLLVDDIITTASTVMAAAEQLAPLGRPIWVAALAYQPLD